MCIICLSRKVGRVTKTENGICLSIPKQKYDPHLVYVSLFKWHICNRGCTKGNKKQLLEKEIAKNNLFKLCTKDAIQCVMKKVGMLYSFFTAGENNKKQQYMKKLIKTNATDIDEITFFQESLKWICRWCSKYCATESNYSGEIFAD